MSAFLVIWKSQERRFVIAGNSAALRCTRRKTSCKRSSAAVDDDGNRAAKKRRRSPRNCCHAFSTPDELALSGFFCGDITTTLRKTMAARKDADIFEGGPVQFANGLRGVQVGEQKKFKKKACL